ncbi:enoyl-CoA hydratase-related protein [Gordonia sp. NPDC003376]
MNDHEIDDRSRGRVDLHIETDTGVATVTMSRPAKLNSLTQKMYDDLHDACDVVENAPGVRVVILCGAGPAFCSGSDIEWFRTFSTGDDGVDYDRRFVELVQRVEGLGVPTVAAVRGVCVGAGLVLAAACDVRVAATDATFGLPIARTLGNVLSAYPVALLAERLGGARLMALVATAAIIDVDVAVVAGFVTDVATPDELGRAAHALAMSMRDGSAGTVAATRQTLARLRRSGLPDTSDLVREAYSSQGFRDAVRCFGEGTAMNWAAS